MKTLLKTTLFIFTGFMFSCKNEDVKSAHPLAGDWMIKNVESKKYLAYTDDETQPAFDIGIGVTQVMTVLAGPNPDQYYIIPKANKDIYLSTAGAIYTYIAGTNFSNSTDDLFAFVPINGGSDRYYIQSVADPSRYLVSCYSCYGRSSTLSIQRFSPGYWDSIWILEKP